MYNWKAKNGGLSASDLKRLKGLEAENVRLQKMYANRSLVHDLLNNAVGKSSKKLSVKLLCGSKPVHDEPDHCDVDEALDRLTRSLEVPAQPTRFVQPRKRAFDNPPTRQYREALPDLVHNLDRPVSYLLGPLGKRSPIEATITSAFPQARQLVLHRFEHLLRSSPLSHRRCRDMNAAVT